VVNEEKQWYQGTAYIRHESNETVREELPICIGKHFVEVGWPHRDRMDGDGCKACGIRLVRVECQTGLDAALITP
jgi:hypothetical protein